MQAPHGEEQLGRGGSSIRLVDIEHAWHMSEARSDHFRAGDTRETNNSQPNQLIKLEQDLQPFDVLVAKVLIENVSNYTQSWGPRR
jgi:hypothetical protein